MGLLLSVLVVCVGVLEAVSCFRHIQHGYLPFWLPRGQPILAERHRRKPSDASSSSDEEMSLLMAGDVMLSPKRAEPHYGLTPILAEHRRNTPILREEEADDEGEGAEDKYALSNSLDDRCYDDRCHDDRSSEVIDNFRPISPTDSGQDGANEVGGASDSLGSARFAAETHERCESEVTLNGEADDLEVSDVVEGADFDAPLEPLEAVEPLESLACTGTRNEDTTNAETLSTPREPDAVKRPDLEAPSSRPSTPSTPRKVKADISWPISHPDMSVIKRPSTELGRALRLSLSKDDSIDEDLLDADLETTSTERQDDEEHEQVTEFPSERVIESQESQTKPSLDMFLESLERLDSSLETKDSDENFEKVETHFEEDRRPDLDTLLECLEIASPPSGVHDFVTEQINFDSLPNPTSPHIPTLPKIPDLPAAASPKVTSSDFHFVDDFFSKTVVEEPLELSTPYVEVQAVPPSRTTTGTQAVETPPGRAMIDAFGRIVGVESDEEVARRLEALIEPRDVERAFEKKVIADTERMVSLKDIFEPVCRKETAFSVAAAQETEISAKEVVPEAVELPKQVFQEAEESSEEAVQEDVELQRKAVQKAEESSEEAVQEAEELAKEAVQEDVELPKEAVQEAESSEEAVQEAVKEANDLNLDDDVEELSQPTKESFELVDVVATEEESTDLNDLQPELSNSSPDVAILDKPTNEIASQLVTPVAIETPETLTVQPESFRAQPGSMVTPDSTITTDSMARTETLAIADSPTNPETLKPTPASMPSQPSIEVDKADDDDDMGTASESLALCKDITSKESSIKRRKSYKKRSPRASTESLGGEDKTQSKERRRELTASREEEPTVEEFLAQQLVATGGVLLLPASKPGQDLVAKKSEKLTELSPSQEVLLEYTSPDDDVETRERSPSPPPTVTKRRESEVGAISNNALLPVEVLHVDVGDVKEAAVFATTSQEERKKLRRPARTESFEEAPVDVRIRGVITSREEGEDGNEEGGKIEDVRDKEFPVGKSSEPDVEERKCDDLGVVVTGSDRIETNPNLTEREPEEPEEEESVSAAGDVKHPTQASNPAFWLIFSGEYTKAMSKDWHSGHFCCWQCDESLTGQRYVLRDDHPYCIKCYESVFANMCEECNKTIGIDSKDLSYKDKHWHEACFLCNKCRVSLVDKQFGSKADKIYCGNCYDSQFASRCDGCGEIFRAGTKKMEYKTRQWHEKCFCCCVCKSAIGTKSFIPREQEIYCATCYEEKFATRCVKCNKIITSGGVTYKNEPWHRECFTCTHCSASLAGQRFTSRDEKPYCADCFGELFAKRCTACVKPITGIGGTRFISFEDRHWHNDCFICASCKTSLVGRGFITDADDIICPECAKQKLM